MSARYRNTAAVGVLVLLHCLPRLETSHGEHVDHEALQIPEEPKNAPHSRGGQPFIGWACGWSTGSPDVPPSADCASTEREVLYAPIRTANARRHPLQKSARKASCSKMANMLLAGEYLPRAIGDYLAAHHRLVDPQAVAMAIIHQRRGEIRARLAGCCSYNPGSRRCHARQEADWFECYCTAAIQFPGGQPEFQRLLDEYHRLN